MQLNLLITRLGETRKEKVREMLKNLLPEHMFTFSAGTSGTIVNIYTRQPQSIIAYSSMEALIYKLLPEKLGLSTVIIRTIDGGDDDQHVDFLFDIYLKGYDKTEKDKQWENVIEEEEKIMSTEQDLIL